jgi:ADP-dependent NAD(P)H-hydrate dehydratase / NAD(P)H-hydrate epimerase
MIPEAQWVLRAAQQHALDAASVRLGTSAEVLMESAGRHAAGWILSHVRPRSAAVLAGPGGNGGDALVVARHLLLAGVSVQTFLRCAPSSCSSHTRAMAERLQERGGRMDMLGGDPAPLCRAAREADCLVDGLFGSGLSRPLADEDIHLVEAVNRTGARIVSLDLPSGLASDTGEMPGPALRAEVTLAMAFYKPSHWLYPAAAWCGDVHVVEVEYPEEAVAHCAPTAQVLGRKAVRSLLPARDPSGHKGTFGRVLAVVGSQGMTGAAILCARGALRAGAGLVTLALPRTIAPVVQAAVPEALTVPLPDQGGRLAGPGIDEALRAAMQRADVLAIGPGLSRAAGTLELVRAIIREFEGRLVIDADALYALIGREALLSSISARAVLTPHPGELAALTGWPSEDVDASRLDCVETSMPGLWPCLVLKGRPTLIRTSAGSIVINPTGNTGLATGGSGDVLTGLLAGLMAGGCSPADAAMVGAFVHGLAADRWAGERSERSFTPSDLIDGLSYAFKELES